MKKLLQTLDLRLSHEGTHVLLKGFFCLLKRDGVAAVAQVHLLEDVLEDLVCTLLLGVFRLRWLRRLRLLSVACYLAQHVLQMMVADTCIKSTRMHIF